MTEREQFEAWWATMEEAPYYEGVQKAVAWNAWNRRAQPAQAVPVLTDEQIDEAADDDPNSDYGCGFYSGARWAEQAVLAKLLGKEGA